MDTFGKIKDSVSAGPLGAVSGAVLGYLIAKKFGYDKSFAVVSFTMVGLMVGAGIGMNLKKK